MTVSWAETGFVSVRGCALEYTCCGPPPHQAPTLVLLHEGLGSAALWRDFPSLLTKATGLGVCAYSRAGYGRSDPTDLPRPLDYMTREATEVLPEVLDAFGVVRTILVGHSDGATIAALYAGLIRDHRVAALILMAPHFFAETVALDEIARARVAYEQGELRPRLARHHENVDNAFYGWNDSWLHPDFRHWDVTDAINGIEVPVLAIQGAQDQYGTLRQIEFLEERGKAQVRMLVLDDCRHAPFAERPTEVISSVQRFLSGLPKTDADAFSSPTGA